MTPGARLQTALEIAAKTDAADAPADRVLSAAFRQRRYAGSKDRRAIGRWVYALLRHRARLGWWIERTTERTPDWRTRLIALLVLVDGVTPADVAGLFSGAKYCPDVMSDSETALANSLAATLAGQAFDHGDMPPHVRLEIPPWLADTLTAAWGDSLTAEMTALNQAAPVDVRINTLKGSREDAFAALAAAEIVSAPTPMSPVGLRLVGTPRLDDLKAYKEGLIEVQDEGSQLIALLTGAAPGMTVFDVCAGAGGKALALASMMQNKGRLIAADSAENRLKRMAPRLRRSGATIIETRVICADAWPEDERNSADRVLADVPCSGSGAWRRHPEARWRLTPEALSGHVAAQREILGAAAHLVKPGGRLIYATCSVLTAENAEQVAWFLDSHPDFALLPADKVWAETIGGTYPFSGPRPGPCLSLTPASTQTDGFFAAVLEKRDS